MGLSLKYNHVLEVDNKKLTLVTLPVLELKNQHVVGVHNVIVSSVSDVAIFRYHNHNTSCATRLPTCHVLAE